MVEKECTVCHQVKPIDLFNKSKRGAYGRRADCKKCESEKGKKYRDNPAYKDKRRVYRKEVAHKYTGKYDYKERYKGKYAATIKKSVAAWYQANPGAENAHRAVHREIAGKRMPKASALLCAKCKNQARHYHHHNGYNQDHWLDVIPLCAKCHKNAHTHD